MYTFMYSYVDTYISRGIFLRLRNTPTSNQFLGRVMFFINQINLTEQFIVNENLVLK